MASGSEQISKKWIEGAKRECVKCGVKITNLAKQVGEVRSTYPGPKREIVCVTCMKLRNLEAVRETRERMGLSKITVVRFIGGPFDGLVQGWHAEEIELPDSLRMSSQLARERGGMKREVTDPRNSGMLLENEIAKDETVYRRRDTGVYYHEAIPDDFGVDPPVTA